MIFSNEEKSFMQSALTKAKESFNHGEVPVGAVVVNLTDDSTTGGYR